MPQCSLPTMDSSDLEDAYRVVENIMGSTLRCQVFLQLIEGRKTRQDLIEETDIGDSALTAAKYNFVEYDLMEDDDSFYELTLTGRLVAESLHESFLRAKLAYDLSPFIHELFGENDTELEEIIVELAGSEVVSEEVSRESPRNAYREVVGKADYMRELVPWRTEMSFFIEQQIKDGELEAEFIVDSEEMNDVFYSHSVRDRMEEIIQTDQATYFEYEGVFPGFTLSLVDEETVCLLSYGDSLAFVRTESPQVRDWAERTYELYRSDATVVEP